MVIEPFVRMGPPPRSLAAEANDCFMVRTQYGYNRIQVCGAGTGAQWQVPLGSICYLSPLCHRPASVDFRAAVMDCAKENAAYEMPLTSKRPYKGLPLVSGLSNSAMATLLDGGDLLRAARGADHHRELAPSLQCRSPACLNRLPGSSPGGVRSRAHHMAGCATSTGSGRPCSRWCHVQS